MRMARLHRRLVVLMSLASLLAFAGGAGLVALSALLTTAGLLVALFWQPTPELSARMERLWLPIALLLVARALVHVFLIRDDVVIPVVDLLFLLLTAESLRSLDAANDARIKLGWPTHGVEGFRLVSDLGIVLRVVLIEHPLSDISMHIV